MKKSQYERYSIYGHKHIHEHVKRLAQYEQARNPREFVTISNTYDRILVAGIQLLYQQVIPLDLPPPTSPPPIPARGGDSE